MAGKKRYDQEFVEKAIVLLEANGYPDRRGALKETAIEVGLPNSTGTLARWYYGQDRLDVTEEMIQGQRIELKTIIEEQVYAIADRMPIALETTKNARDVAVAFGIMFDKLRLITGESTANISIHQRITKLDTILNAARSRRDQSTLTELE